MTQGAKRNATTDRDTSRPRMLARLSGDLAGCAAALILGVFCVVVADVLVSPEGATAAPGAPPGLLRGLMFLFSTAFLPGLTFSPHPQQIEAARRGYDDWCQALGWVRDGLIVGGMLREVEVTAAMPRVKPWLHFQRSPMSKL